jgi:hypothetical protein
MCQPRDEETEAKKEKKAHANGIGGTLTRVPGFKYHA